MKTEEPDPGADDHDDYSIRNKCPVQNDQAHINVVGLDYCTNRDNNRGEEEDSQNQAGGQCSRAEDHVH